MRGMATSDIWRQRTRRRCKYVHKGIFWLFFTCIMQVCA